MRTAVVSDLHLGALGGSDVAREPDRLARLLEAVADADRLVLLGDTLELRERPVAEALDVVHPFFETLGAAFAGRAVVLVPGNHDHALAAPWLDRLRLDGADPGSEDEWPVAPEDGLAGRLAAFMPEARVSLAYPGLRLRSDVYATHGHYLDLHLTVPRIESIAASAMGRMTGRGEDCRSTADYEAVLSPMYAFYEGLAEGAAASTLTRGGSMSRSVWRRATGGRSRAGRLLLGRITIPGAVAALNRFGLGPFKPELTGEELRRSGLVAMGRVAEAIAPPEAAHVIFGHTHRPGPLRGDDVAEWTTAAGVRLWNTGNWFHEYAFLSNGDPRSPYWPGTVLLLDDDGPPALDNVLRDR